MGTTLEFLFHLWETENPNDPPPEYNSFAQTSGGVVNALDMFTLLVFRESDRLHLFDDFNARRTHRLGVGVMTFREEFLHLSRKTAGGLLVVVVGVGNAVKSVDTWDPGAPAPRALNREQARALWAKDTPTVVVDTVSAQQIFLYRIATAHAPPLLKLAESPPPAPPESAPHAPGAPSVEVLKTRALLKATREALLPENWALRPVS